jgi:hypothetical protein
VQETLGLVLKTLDGGVTRAMFVTDVWALDKPRKQSAQQQQSQRREQSPRRRHIQPKQLPPIGGIRHSQATTPSLVYMVFSYRTLQSRKQV